MTPARRAAEIAKAAAILALAVVVYLPATRAGFVWNDWDLTGNIVLQKDGLYRVWFTAESTNYWPLTWTSYWIEYQLWGLNPAGYHLVNIVIHALACLVIWRVLLQLKIPAAWAAAMLFAVHPVNVESVAWITQRKNTLCLLFYVISLWQFLHWMSNRKPISYVGSVLSFVLAMLSKGAAVGLPLVLLLFCWWRNGRVSWRDLFSVSPFLAIAAIMGAVEVWFQYNRAIGDEVIRDASIVDRTTAAGWIVGFYLSKALVPLNLSFVYPKWEIDPRTWLAQFPNVALLAALGIAIWKRRTWGRPLLFGLAYYVVMLGPVLGFVDIYFMKYSLVADHYQYLALPGLIAFVAGWLWTLLGRRHRRMASVALGTAMLACSMLTWRQTHAYHDRLTLWRDTLAQNADCTLAHYNLGTLLLKQGSLTQARYHLSEALRIEPDDARALSNLGAVFQAEGQDDLAIDLYARALQIDPEIPAAHSSWADLLRERGAVVDAVRHYRAALRIEPNNASVHNNLGTALESLGRTSEALQHYRHSLQSAPDMIPTQKNLERLLERLGEQDDLSNRHSTESPTAEPLPD